MISPLVPGSPGPYLGPWGVYAPSNVTGPITWTGGVPFADAQLMPSVEVWNNDTGPAQSFIVDLTVFDASGKVVATSSGPGTTSGAVTTWTPPQPLPLPGATLWHLVPKPALYTLATSLTVGSIVVDAHNVTFGVRTIRFDGDTGFYLNGVATKSASVPCVCVCMRVAPQSYVYE